MIQQDPLLIEERGLSVDNSDLLFTSIPQKNVEVVAAYLQLVVSLSFKKILVLEIFNNAKKIFDDTYIKENDKYWKEHLAATFREPFDNGFEANLFNALKHLPKRGDSDEAGNLYKYIQDTKEFLNNLAHMRYDKALKYINENYSEYNEITESIFSQICKDLIDRLYEWFCKHCYKNSN